MRRELLCLANLFTLQPMALTVCGLNHQTAPLSVREQAVFAPEATGVALKDLLSQRVASEAVILSTCNRTELYADTEDPAALGVWLAKHHGLCCDTLSAHLYIHQEASAVQHIMRVASGVDSMVLGESQILGQLKTAYDLARRAGSVGVQLERLLQNVFSVSKQVRAGTALGESPVSIAYVAVSLAKRIFSNLNKACVLLVGAGDTIDIVAMHLCNQGVKRLIVANRTVEKAEKLAAKFAGHAISIAEIPVYLKEADIVVTATASQLPIFGKGALETALKIRKHRPIFMVDIAVPRDIESEVGELEDVYLYNLDDLQTIASENLKSRQGAAKQAEAIIELQAQHFMREWQALKGVNTLCAYRQKIEMLCDDVALKALQQLHRGQPAETVIHDLTRALANKIMHDPTIELRQASYDGKIELLMLARRLFGI